MPRQPRIDLPGVPQLVVQRGNDRGPCFFLPIDRERYLDELRVIAHGVGCALHAYVLITNHVHLLLTPSGSGPVSAVMQALGRRYARYVNDRYHRTGTLWEGRYKACPVDSETYLLRCDRYIELNPVRAATGVDAGRPPVVELCVECARRARPAFTAPQRVFALGADGPARQQAYQALMAEALTAEDLELIQLRLHRQHVLGSDRVRAAIEAQLYRRAGPAKIGRPRKWDAAAVDA